MINFSEKEKEFQNSKQHVHKKMNPFTIWLNQNEQVIEQVMNSYIYIIKQNS
jgi:hypothetical protein